MVVQVKAEPSQADWTKVCGKDQGSGNEHHLRALRALHVVDRDGQHRLALVGDEVAGGVADPGIRFTVDNGQPTPGRYAVCFPNGCFAEAPGLKATASTAWPWSETKSRVV
jgi:hypothetical protein